jgi:hypothetical protein
MEREDGISAGQRNIGRFFLSAIPLVLGVAAATWFGLWITGHNYSKQLAAEKHELTQEQRAAVYVGARVRPQGKLVAEIDNKSCLEIVRVDVDTEKKGYPYDDADYQYSLIMYAQNKCGEDLTYAAYHWQAVSPNGTLLEADYKNTAGCPVPMQDEVAECSFLIDPDTRVDKVQGMGDITAVALSRSSPTEGRDGR